MKKIFMFLLVLVSLVTAQNSDIAYWRLNAGCWGTETFSEYISGVDTVWVGPIRRWPYQAFHVEVSDTAGTPSDSVSFQVDMYMWSINDTTKSIVHKADMTFKSHITGTGYSPITTRGEFQYVITPLTAPMEKFVWLKIKTAAAHKKLPGMKFDVTSVGYNEQWR